MRQPTLEQIKRSMITKGMKVFAAPYDMTLGGIRTKDTKANTFNDWVFMMYHDADGNLQGEIHLGTTDAGLYFRLKPMHIEGTAIIMHDVQHRGAYTYMKKGGHRGQEAFRQTGLMRYWRDADRDSYLDFDGEEQEAIFNTNGHDMGTRGTIVSNWSAGCWGAVRSTMDRFYILAQEQIDHGHGSKFSFAMLYEPTF
jgi:hypothetical protein